MLSPPFARLGQPWHSCIRPDLYGGVEERRSGLGSEFSQGGESNSSAHQACAISSEDAPRRAGAPWCTPPSLSELSYGAWHQEPQSSAAVWTTRSSLARCWSRV